jgi:Flp pilus assembly protein TadD
MGRIEINHHLVELEQRALDFRNSGHLEEAAKLFSKIVKEQPDWEHGMGFYNLAGCYEDLGRLELAEEYYNAALRFEPANPIYLGGLASFLYLHGEPEKAFSTHLELLRVEKMNKHESGIESLILASRALGKKMELSESEVTERIDRIPASVSVSPNQRNG